MDEKQRKMLGPSIFRIIAVLFMHSPNFVDANCSKAARTLQEQKLVNGMNETDVVIEAKYTEEVSGMLK